MLEAMLSALLALANMAHSVETAENCLEVKEHSSGQAIASQPYHCSPSGSRAQPSANSAPPLRRGLLSLLRP